MGQYYKPYLLFSDGCEEAYNSQNVIFKTLHGIPAEEDPVQDHGRGQLLSSRRFFRHVHRAEAHGAQLVRERID